MVVAIRPLIMSKHEGTVLVISIVFTPASMAVRQAWKPASALSVRSTPQRRLGKTSAIDRIDRLRLVEGAVAPTTRLGRADRKSTRLNSSHSQISYAVFCLKK